MTMRRTLSPFVLVHGGRHGGWCWARVAPLLREAGYDVYAPTLTGLGERAHLLGPEIGLGTHIQDLVAVFEFEDVTDAVLVGHSYGGFPIAGAMEQIADRVRSVVFVDALVPRSGESMFDIVAPEIERQLRQLAEREGEGWYLPTSAASFYGVSEPADVAWLNSKLTAQPLKTYTDAIGTAERVWTHAGAFIECAPSQLTPDLLQRMRARSEAEPTFTYRVVDCAHDMMVTEPELLTDLLLGEVEAEFAGAQSMKSDTAGVPKLAGGSTERERFVTATARRTRAWPKERGRPGDRASRGERKSLTCSAFADPSDGLEPNEGSIHAVFR